MIFSSFIQILKPLIPRTFEMRTAEGLIVFNKYLFYS